MAKRKKTKGGKTKKYQTRYILSDYGYRGKRGTEIEVVDISKDTELVYGIPKKELTKFQKEMLPFEYEFDDTSVLPVKDDYDNSWVGKAQKGIEDFFNGK